jgi:hypothetical protein
MGSNFMQNIVGISILQGTATPEILCEAYGNLHHNELEGFLVC